jgi:hypothetical protein
LLSFSYTLDYENDLSEGDGYEASRRSMSLLAESTFKKSFELLFFNIFCLFSTKASSYL